MKDKVEGGGSYLNDKVERCGGYLNDKVKGKKRGGGVI